MDVFEEKPISFKIVSTERDDTSSSIEEKPLPSFLDDFHQPEDGPSISSLGRSITMRNSLRKSHLSMVRELGHHLGGPNPGSRSLIQNIGLASGISDSLFEQPSFVSPTLIIAERTGGFIWDRQAVLASISPYYRHPYLGGAGASLLQRHPLAGGRNEELEVVDLKFSDDEQEDGFSHSDPYRPPHGDSLANSPQKVPIDKKCPKKESQHALLCLTKAKSKSKSRRIGKSLRHI